MFSTLSKRRLLSLGLSLAILSGCTTDRYDFDSRPADTSARTPLKPTTLDRLEHGSHADSYRWNPKPNKP